MTKLKHATNIDVLSSLEDEDTMVHIRKPRRGKDVRKAPVQSHHEGHDHDYDRKQRLERMLRIGGHGTIGERQ